MKQHTKSIHFDGVSFPNPMKSKKYETESNDQPQIIMEVVT